MSESQRIATNLRTLLILEALAQANEPLTPTEINRNIGLPKQSIHRLCQTLIDEGFLTYDLSGKRLQPTARTLSLAHGLFNTRHNNIARHQILVNLSNTTQETVNFVLPTDKGMTYLDRVETDWIFRIELPVGSFVPFHCTASGKCFLASLEPKQLHHVLSSAPLKQHTQNTITDTQILQAQITTIQKNGYAIDNEEFFNGMVALAVPVLDEKGNFLAAVAFHGPTQRLNTETLTQHLDTMRQGAKQLAQLASDT